MSGNTRSQLAGSVQGTRKRAKSASKWESGLRTLDDGVELHHVRTKGITRSLRKDQKSHLIN